jgi:hypothetical protein
MRLYSQKKKSSFRLDVTEGLVGTGLLVGILVGHGDIIVRRVGGVLAVLGSIGLGSEGRVGGTNGLVGVRSLLGSDAAAVIVAVLVTVGGPARAAASAEHPEEGTGQREDNCEPCGGVDILAHGHFDAVGFHGCSEGTLRDGEHDCRGKGGAQCEEERDNRDNGSDTAAPATEDGENPDQDLSAGGNECDKVGDEHPFGDSLVDLHDLLQTTAKLLLKLGFTHAQDGRRVEVEFSLRLCAGGDSVLAVGDVALAVTPETNVVEVGDGGIILKGIDEACDLAVGDINSGLAKFILDCRYGVRIRTHI